MMGELSSTAIFHLYYIELLHVIGKTWRSEGKGLLSPLTILKTWMLGAKVKDMEDILIKLVLYGVILIYIDCFGTKHWRQVDAE
jgi:hypothetical protein